MISIDPPSEPRQIVRRARPCTFIGTNNPVRPPWHSRVFHENVGCAGLARLGLPLLLRAGGREAPVVSYVPDHTSMQKHVVAGGSSPRFVQYKAIVIYIGCCAVTRADSISSIAAVS